MTVREHVYAIKNLFNNGTASDDARLTNRLILHFLNIARLRLIKDKLDQTYYVSEQSYQDLCLDLEPSSFHACCSIDYDYCPILRSTVTLPKFLDSKWGNQLKALDLSGRLIPNITLTQVRYQQYGLVPQQVGYFIHNNYLYVVNTTSLVKVIINGLFDNPEEIHLINCPNTEETPCDYLTEEFPIESDLIERMYRLVIELLTVFFSTAQDLTNNAIDDRATQANRSVQR